MFNVQYFVSFRSEDVTYSLTLSDDNEGHLDIDVFPNSMHSFVYW